MKLEKEIKNRISQIEVSVHKLKNWKEPEVLLRELESWRIGILRDKDNENNRWYISFKEIKFYGDDSRKLLLDIKKKLQEILGDLEDGI